MTVNDVKHYRFLDKAIRAAEKRIDAIREGDVVFDKVTGSNPEYPYEERSFSISGRTSSQVAMIMAISERDRLVQIKSEIETALHTITDPMDKVIFERTMRGQSQKQIALHLKVNQGTISRRLAKLCEYF